jgi:hypothetical protein
MDSMETQAMRPAITSQMVAILARSAGFEFAPERCELLAPQLEWLLAQGDLLNGLGLAAEESVLILHLDTQRAAGPVNGGPENG